ncbi:uncharacterized protein [Zea mays]|uniref:uncharacterized protein isoform X2 n=1 Tax=Zea mays TaxID=4577 RepID=UPI0004DE966D|nr:uncharacterized protein LOC103654111 isoform X2 [Zea mays]XP_020408291.1 uncharacterized protein LOC103654111 isoform X2 [Zea mays]XP_020408292.1 uncharacterized protein LOC103654111 isoform X2 [Zea mays]XP_035823311.1 uncharacterized protein LOC103654111 isoform X2 [Zea mays]|eukprot:XP_020408289.1 uncharacterized protein LOC103654111 isoform X2 [Zea mays]
MLRRPPPLRLGTRNRATTCHMRHTAAHQSRSPLSLSALAPAGTKATCRRALHRRRHHLVPAQVTCCRCHAIKREEGPVAAAISADRVALLAHLAGPLDASLHPCSLPTPKQLSGDIHEEVETHNRMLDRMGSDMDTSRGFLSGTVGKFKTVFETKSTGLLLDQVESSTVKVLWGWACSRTF